MFNDKPKIILISFIILSVLFFFFTPLVAPTLYGNDISFVTVFIFQWALSDILWRQGFKLNKTLLLWIILSMLLVIVCFLRDRLMFSIGHKSWYHPVPFYIYIGVPTTIWWIIVQWVISKKRNIQPLLSNCLTLKAS